MDKPRACREKSNCGGRQQNTSRRSIRLQSGIRPSQGEGHRHTPLHGVCAGVEPRHCRKSREVVGALGCKQDVPGIGAMDQGN